MLRTVRCTKFRVVLWANPKSLVTLPQVGPVCALPAKASEQSENPYEVSQEPLDGQLAKAPESELDLDQDHQSQSRTSADP